VWIFVFYATYRIEDIDTLHSVAFWFEGFGFCVYTNVCFCDSFSVFVKLCGTFLEGTDISWLFCVTAVVGFRVVVWFSRFGQGCQSEG